MSETPPNVRLGPGTSMSSGSSGRTSMTSGKESIGKESVDSTSSTSSNPLVGRSRDEILEDAERFARENGLEEYVEVIKRGALVAQNPTELDRIPGLTEEERAALQHELDKPWSQPFMLYYLVVMCSLAACVQGMDESVINGANLFFPTQFGIDPTAMGDSGSNRNQWLLGLVNSAPYLCCAVAGCWLSAPLNHRFGRRGTIFIGACICLVTCVWQAVSDSWQLLFAARFVLGFGIGPNSATVPVFAGECAPTAIRGALVGMWQVFTAFGIMLGYVSDLAFQKVPNKPHIRGLNWRLMLGSAGIPALILLVQIWFCPESPRWLVSKGRNADAWRSLLQLRHSQIQAARDLYYIQVLHKAQAKQKLDRNPLAELFGVRRNRRAAVASLILMFMQQFCGINAIAYYSSNVFTQSGFNDTQALLASWGFGLTNWLFAFPALWTIDRFGRRNLVLTSYPLMAVFLLMTGLAFLIPGREARVGVIAAGIYLFTISYSPGAGPVPFAYSAEAYPMAVRDFGMSLSTAWLWFFNFVVAITFPPLIGAFTSTGAFAWYAGWNCIGFVLAFFFVPETKGRSLEDLDNVFSQPGREYARDRLRVWKRFGHGMENVLHRRHRGESPLREEDSRAGVAV